MKSIPRSNINQLLDIGLNYPLTLIVAPPGSGKSTALDQWISIQKYETGKHIKTICFDAAPKFNDGDTLFLQIFKRLSTITPLWEASFFKLFKSDQEADIDTLIEIFIQGLSQIPHPITIAIDDFHHIKSPRIFSIFNGLLSQLPSHITFILSSRKYPDLSISKFKIEERVFIIDGNDLKLDKEELSNLNALLCDSQVNKDQLTSLLQQTEGWFVGIKLALLAYTKNGDKALENFSGTQPELLNYFAHEVINKLPTELKEIVLTMSICSSFDQELCDALSEDANNLVKLEELSQHELLINPELETVDGYRFHPLLQTFLLQRLEIEIGKEALQSLHLKASKCLLSQHKTSQAIYHARQSNNASFYFQTLLAATVTWLKQGEFEPIIDALNELSEQELNRHPQLHIYLIYALTFSRRFNQASFHLDTMKQQSSSQAEIDTMRFLRFLINIFQSDAEMQNLSFPNHRLSADTPADVIGFYLIIEAYNNLYNGNLNEAFKLATKAKHLLTSINHDYFLSYATLIIILCDRYLGRGIQAIELMINVFKPIKHGPKTPVWVNITSGMIVVDYEQNRLDEALELGEQLIPQSSHSSITEVIVNAYLYSAKISHILGNKGKAKRLLDQLERILSLGDYQRFNSQIIHEKMRQAFQEGSVNSSELIYKQYELANALKKGIWCKKTGRYEEHRERLALASVYALMSKGNFEQAIEILNEIVLVLDRQALPSRALIARCNLAMITLRQNKTDDAVRQLKRLVERYGLVCFSRTIFDEAPGLEKLFQLAADKAAITIPALFYKIFASLFGEQETLKAFTQPRQCLTEKELAIFELLSGGLSNADIATQSGIALSTTKWHLKNIYQKLGVENRSAAVMLAHRNIAT